MAIHNILKLPITLKGHEQYVPNSLGVVTKGVQSLPSSAQPGQSWGTPPHAGTAPPQGPDVEPPLALPSCPLLASR